jgi:transposase-like protein
MQAVQRRPIEDSCCQNKDCENAGQRGKGNLYFRGWSGRGQRIRMAYCRTCKRTFSERKGTPLEDSRLPEDKAVSLLEHIREGTGTRATSRLVKVDKNTVTRYIALAGSHAEKIHPELVAFSPSDP